MPYHVPPVLFCREIVYCIENALSVFNYLPPPWCKKLASTPPPWRKKTFVFCARVFVDVCTQSVLVPESKTCIIAGQPNPMKNQEPKKKKKK
jgi:hypothetical protein